jgi:hypothetical protein
MCHDGKKVKDNYWMQILSEKHSMDLKWAIMKGWGKKLFVLEK